MPTTNPPAAPNRYADPVVFSDAVDAFLAWMSTGFAEGAYILNHDATPVVPAAGGAIIAGLTTAGMTYPVMTFSNGLTREVQVGIPKSYISSWKAIFSSSTLTTLGNASQPSATGTATAVAYGVTDRYARIPKVEYLETVASITAVAGFRSAQLYCTVGATTANEGGFRFYGVWGPSTGVSVTTNRGFFGLANSVAAPTDVEPSTLINCIGLGWDAADARVQIMHNDGSGACTKIALGVSFNVPTTDRAALYSLELYSPPGTTQTVDYLVTDLVSGATATGTISTNLPTTSTSLGYRGYLSVGGTNSVIGCALGGVYIDPLI